MTMPADARHSPKVSVCVIAYNQAPYIAECLQSILDQETNFEFEIIVGDDFSTDGTKEIIADFASRYPSIIKPIFQPTNTRGSKNNLHVHAAATGMYVAHIDGDDLMLPGKLQAQADSLDQNPDIALATHSVKVIGSDRLYRNPRNYPTMGTINDLLMLGAYFVHSSTMYRKCNAYDHPDSLEAVDYYFYFEHASKGHIFFDQRVLGAYRVHGHGISSSLERREELEQLYEAAFDRALTLGASPEVVKAARLDRRMWFAVARYLAADYPAFRRLIKLEGKDRDFASRKHLILHWTRRFPFPMWAVRIVRNVKRRFRE